MGVFESALFGIVEGITEFLPISSTGHLILASSALGIAQSNFHKSFEIIIQLGAICAVIVLYWKSFLNIEVLKRLLVAFVPTAIVGFLLYDFIKTSLIGNEMVVLWALVLGGIGLIVFELIYKEKESAIAASENMSYAQAFLIGLFQSIAVIPGTSRSAASILGGLIVGLKRVAIVEFSFLLAVPTMLAASGLDIYRNAPSLLNGDLLPLIVGFCTSFIVAMIAIKFLLGFVRTHTFIPFGIYRILIALLFFFIIL